MGGPAPPAAEDLELWTEVTRSCGWWWPCQQECVISERPIVVHRDAQDRLHNRSEAAVRYRDGLHLFFWHGTRVPDGWITHSEQLGPRTASSQQNLERRRAAEEIMGSIPAIELAVVDRDPDPAVGQLLEVSRSEGATRLLRVRCGTGRTFVLRVPPNMSTARQANAWTYGLEPEDYQLEVRT